MRSYWIRVDVTGDMSQGWDTDVQGESHINTQRHRGKRSWEDGGRIWNDKPRNSFFSEARRGARKRPSLAPSKGACPYWHVDFRLLDSRTVRQFFVVLSLSFVVFCQGSLRKLIQEPSSKYRFLGPTHVDSDSWVGLMKVFFFFLFKQKHRWCWCGGSLGLSSYPGGGLNLVIGITFSTKTTECFASLFHRTKGCLSLHMIKKKTKMHATGLIREGVEGKCLETVL